MITSLRLVDFKNFADETLKLGPFTVIVGANASGKSNIRDCLSIPSRHRPRLHLRGDTRGEIRCRRTVGVGTDSGRDERDYPSWRRFGRRSIYIFHNRRDNHEDRNALFLMKVGCNPDGSDEFCVLEEEVCHSSGPVYKSTGTFGSNSLLTFGNEDVEAVPVSGSQPTLVQIFQKKEFWFKDELKAEDSLAEMAQIIEKRLPWNLVALDSFPNALLLQWHS